MIVGVIGWWHYGNEGDFKILECLRRSLLPHDLVPIDAPFKLTADVIRRLNRLDFVLIGGGGLFIDGPPRPFNTFHQWSDELQTPLGVVGVGVDAIANENHPALGALLEQAQFFYVRDRVSLELLAHPKVGLIPDLTFLHPQLAAPRQQKHPSKVSPVCGVNLRKMPGIQMDGWIKTLQRIKLDYRGIPLSTYGKWSETDLLGQINPQCASQFSPDLYRGLDLMVGTAFHSIIFAIQNAVPIIAIAYAPKVPRLMRELELGDYVLPPDAWDQLPDLIERTLQERDHLIRHLHTATMRMRHEARRTFTDVREQIETERQHKRRRDQGKVSIVILGSNRTELNEKTLRSCLDQTYQNVEILFVQERTSPAPTTQPTNKLVRKLMTHPQSSLGNRLNRAFSHAQGRYCTWIRAGDAYAPDAIAYMVDQLAQDNNCDLVFADYYTLHERDHIAQTHFAEAPDRLFRRNVIGPCFLYRRSLHERVGTYRSDTPLAAYDFWLRVGDVGKLQPLHLPLCYQHPSNVESNSSEARNVRRLWRRGHALHERIFWRAMDSEIAETLIIGPLLPIWHKLRDTAKAR
jgi:polysaccharide pyruvyl transferase WcaK-like protein